MNKYIKPKSSKLKASLLLSTFVSLSLLNSVSYSGPAQALVKNYFGQGSGQRVNSNEVIEYNGKTTYNVMGGVIKKPSKRPSYAKITTPVSNGQTQIVALGTSDGGDRSRDVNSLLNKKLMEEQDFKLIGNRGPRDARVEVWARGYHTNNPKHNKNVYISGDSNAVAWTIHTLKANISITNLQRQAKESSSGVNVQSSGSGYTMAIPLKPDNSNKIKFVAMFLDDTTDIIDKNSHLTSFSGQGDGDTFFSGLWGSEPVPEKIRVIPREDKGFDAAVVTTYIP